MRLAGSIRVYLGIAWLAFAPAALADETNAAVLQRRAAFHAGVSACLSDRARLCPDVAPGQGRIIACLVAHADQLSPACITAMDRASDVLMSAARALKPDPVVKTLSK